MARTFLAALLLTLSVLSAISANVVVWVNRTVFDTDRFVATVEPALRDPDVQEVMSQRLAAELYIEADAEARIREQLPPRLIFLARPLTLQTQDLVARAVLRALQTELAGEVSTRLLTEVHSEVLAILDEDQSSLVQRENNEIVIDLHDLLVRAADNLGVGENSAIAQRIDIPPDAGRVVIYSGHGDYQWAGTLVQHRQALTWAGVGLALLFFVLAVLVSRDRRLGIRNVGFAIAVAAVISLVVLFVAKDIAAGYARNPDVAREVLDTVLRGLRYQALAMLAIGLLVALVAALLGPSEVATNLRRSVTAPGDSSGQRGRAFEGFVREQQALLRIAGFAAAAFALVIWPDPSARAYAMILILLAVYIVAISLIGSDAPWAAASRDRLGDWRSRYLSPASPDGSRSWIGAHAFLLAGLGIVVAILFLLLTPDLTLRRFVVVLACTFVYLAAIDFLSRSKEPVHDSRPPDLDGGRSATPIRHR